MNFLKAVNANKARLKNGFFIGTIHLIRDQFLGGQRMPNAKRTSEIIVVVVIVTFFRHTYRWNVFKHVDVVAKRQK